MKETWTYEVPPAGTDASGLEDYQVETGDGEPVGKVVAILEHGGERYVAFDMGVPPLERRAVRWEDVFAAALVTLLALFVAAAATDFTWEFALFAVPAALVLVSALVAYRTFQQPYER